MIFIMYHFSRTGLVSTTATSGRPACTKFALSPCGPVIGESPPWPMSCISRFRPIDGASPTWTSLSCAKRWKLRLAVARFSRSQMCRRPMGRASTQWLKPVTQQAGKMSWALMRNPEGLECELFISHAWQEGVFEFLSKVRNSWPRGVQTAWCCMLANPQNLDISSFLQSPTTSPFAIALRAADVMLVVPNRHQSVYTRLWFLGLQDWRCHVVPICSRSVGARVTFIPLSFILYMIWYLKTSACHRLDFKFLDTKVCVRGLSCPRGRQNHSGCAFLQSSADLRSFTLDAFGCRSGWHCRHFTEVSGRQNGLESRYASHSAILFGHLGQRECLAQGHPSSWCGGIRFSALCTFRQPTCCFGYTNGRKTSPCSGSSALSSRHIFCAVCDTDWLLHHGGGSHQRYNCNVRSRRASARLSRHGPVLCWRHTWSEI